MQVRTVVGAGSRVEAGVVPVGEIAIPPDGDVGVVAGAGGQGVGAGERFEEEGFDLGIGGFDAVGEGWDAVVAVFVVGIAEKHGLGIC